MSRQSSLALLCFAGYLLGVASGDPTCGTGACDGEEASLMQQRRHGTSRRTKSAAVSFQGGGWLAEFGFTGLLLAISAGGQNDVDTMTLLQGFDSLVSVSGSSWALSSFIYSKEYLDWMERMKKAADEDIPTVFNEWVDKLNKQLKPCSKFEVTTYMGKVYKKNTKFGYPLPLNLLQTGYAKEAIAQACQVFGRDWGEAIPKMLFGTAGIKPHATFAGTKYNEWAEGKTLIMGVSMPMRSVADTPYYPKSSDNFVQWNGKSTPSVEYHAIGDHPEYMPAAISWTLGASGLKSPEPFCPGGQGLHFNYTGGELSSVMPMASMWEQEYVEKGGDLEISLAAAASSSASGKADVARSRKGGLIACTGQAAIYAAASPGKSVLAAGSSVKGQLQKMKKQKQPQALKKQLDMAANAKVHTLSDGGDTDLMGIVQAVHAGATSIVALALGQIGETGAAGPGALGAFSPEGTMGIGQVFDTSYEEMQAAFNDTSNWLNFTGGEAENSTGEAAATPSGLVKLVTFEKTLTTMDAPWFGITKGHTVQVCFIWLSVNTKILDVGPPMTPFQQYGLLTRDLVSLLRGNEDYSQMLAQKFANYGQQ